ncbi:cytochrome c [Litorilituus lipolyticus]|uniref:Cytochrome c n=2 Tax=Litorilituus lipolyticus TaxID=2491017 RepID=A0A502L8H5_9GAMM|nr:cytochrome c [Litorilituus lipolyticus]
MSQLVAITTLALSQAILTLPAFANATNTNESLTAERKKALTHIVKQDCGSCHGMTLKGGLGPALLPENLEGKTVPFLQYTILHGRTSTAMPPWKSLLTEKEALWIAEQLKEGKVADK